MYLYKQINHPHHTSLGPSQLCQAPLERLGPSSAAGRTVPPAPRRPGGSWGPGSETCSMSGSALRVQSCSYKSTLPKLTIRGFWNEFVTKPPKPT